MHAVHFSVAGKDSQEDNILKTDVLENGAPARIRFGSAESAGIWGLEFDDGEGPGFSGNA